MYITKEYAVRSIGPFLVPFLASLFERDSYMERDGWLQGLTGMVSCVQRANMRGELHVPMNVHCSYCLKVPELLHLVKELQRRRVSASQ